MARLSEYIGGGSFVWIDFYTLRSEILTSECITLIDTDTFSID